MQSNIHPLMADTQLNALKRAERALAWLKSILCISRKVIADIRDRTARRLDKTNSSEVTE